MAKTVVGLFETYSQAQQAAAELGRLGFTSADVSMLAAESTRNAAHGGLDLDGSAAGRDPLTSRNDTADTAERAGVGAGVGAAVGGLAGLLVGIGALAIPGVGPVVAAGPIVAVLAGAGIGAAAGGLIGALTSIGVPEEHAQYYAEGVKRGGTLVTVRARDEQAQQAADVLTRYGAEDVERKEETWRGTQDMVPGTSATTGYAGQSRAAGSVDQPPPPPMATGGATGTEGARQFASTGQSNATNVQGDQRIQVVQEDVKVGKREVERGGVRIYSTVGETPVHEQVTLREEHVHVERRPVDRPVTPGQADAFREQTIELTERSEEVVVGKTARVVEEIVVGKEVGQRVETVNETARHTDVRVDEIPGRQTGQTTGFDAYDSTFRSNWQSSYATSGRSYDQMLPAYRYGYDYGNDARYQGRNWDDVETNLRTDWERDRPGTWESMKGAVRHAWDQVRGRGSVGAR